MKIRRAILLGWVAFFLFVPGVKAASRPVAVEGFWKQVQQTRAWLENEHTAEEWGAQAQAWALIDEIDLGNGQTVKIDTTEIVRRMTARPPDVAGLKAYLSALEEERVQWARTGCGDCQADLLKEILARPQFVSESQSPNAIEQFIKNAWEAINRWLAALFNQTGEAFFLSTEGISIAISIVLALILVLVFRAVFLNLTSEEEIDVEREGEERPLTASLAGQKATTLAGAGDYRSAIRYLYLSALLLLDERGLLRYNRSLTNREYLAQVSEQPVLRNYLKLVVDEFDRVWYGFQTVDEEEYRRYVGYVAAIEAMDSK